MEENDDTERVWNLVDKIGFCMLATRSGEHIKARPMSAYAEPLENSIYFLTDVASDKDEEITRWPNVCLAFADTRGQKYVSLSGVAVVINDRELIKELWATPAKAWWEDEDDQSIRVLKVTPTSAEYWDSPGTVISYIMMAAAAISHTKPDIGDNAEVDL
ncbi:pyridoxamine 5'-phosphate oxidase family protein [Rhizobium tubonense]|uniref:General stress protein n=1 Tax=Rhizobium tubonense TaxID=484088 RepID=A0A2W4CU15_9HYPH|nr:pyridoxamine 5'-phosphate oxidase family protein [Rhizobium tubonense]PZM14378.1 general stress protein [Rhizobium tubonense]